MSKLIGQKFSIKGGTLELKRNSTVAALIVEWDNKRQEICLPCEILSEMLDSLAGCNYIFSKQNKIDE